MFRAAVLALCLGSAAAFVAPKAAHTSSALKAFETEVGAQPPLGFWDPLGILENADQDRFDRLREVEIKHGRVCMLAVLGHVVTASGIRLPGNIDIDGDKFADIPTGLAALSAVPPFGLVQIFFFAGFLELAVMKDITGDAEFVGDFRNGAIDFGWDSFSEDEKLSKRGIELNNGRAAQLGIFGLMVHEGINNNPYILNDILGSPVAFNAGF
mmetsp:Transcript_2833/g.5966  ORF Transcript_2833/g.5966 Transcript_2833/m.5966 type:complete len:212 (+) Transcript_2833:51-686(+)